MKLSAIQAALPREAPGSIEVPPDAFVSEWEHRPRDTVVLGLCLLGAKNKQEALRMARTRVDKNEAECPDRDEAITLAAMRYLVAMAVCDVNDIKKPCVVFTHPLEQVFFALTEGGARFIFDAYQRVEVERSPRFIEANEDEIAELTERMAEGELDNLSAADLSAVRRHLRYALEIVRGE